MLSRNYEFYLVITSYWPSRLPYEVNILSRVFIYHYIKFVIQNKILVLLGLLRLSDSAPGRRGPYFSSIIIAKDTNNISYTVRYGLDGHSKPKHETKQDYSFI